MAGKKQKRGGAPVSLEEALAATRAAHTRVLALAARLEETESTILAAMAPAPAPAAVSSSPAKRPVGRPPKAAATAPAKRPVGRPRTRPVAGAAPATRKGTGRRHAGRSSKG